MNLLRSEPYPNQTRTEPELEIFTFTEPEPNPNLGFVKLAEPNRTYKTGTNPGSTWMPHLFLKFFFVTSINLTVK